MRAVATDPMRAAHRRLTGRPLIPSPQPRNRERVGIVRPVPFATSGRALLTIQDSANLLGRHR
jgi:hypothetical protein